MSEPAHLFEPPRSTPCMSITSDPTTSSTDEPGSRPAGVDVLLTDGTTAQIRSITPEDAPAVSAFHRGLSGNTVQMRYFGAHPDLSDRELERLTRADDPDHLALLAERNGTLVAVAQYDREVGEDEAEVAFVVDDAHQGLGLGTILLEHLASAARRHGIKRFVADTLVVNRRMLDVFAGVGFARRSSTDHEVVSVVMDIAPTQLALDAADRRDYVASIPCWPSIEAVPGEVDLAVIAVPAASVTEAVEACGRKGVAAVVVVSAGFAEVGPEGEAAQRAAARLAHDHSMRMVGPNCFGVLNTAPAVSMNATFAADVPIAGRVGFASQSGGLGIAILAEAKSRDLGLSSFVSLGNKADISGNDLLTWWEQDGDTDVILLYLESFGNARKFARLARRIGRTKPIVVVKSGRSRAGRRAASSHTAALASPEQAVDALFLNCLLYTSPSPRD